MLNEDDLPTPPKPMPGATGMPFSDDQVAPLTDVDLPSLDFDLDDDTTITDLPDGGALVTLGDDEDDAAETKHSDNLALVVPETELQSIASTLLRLIEEDKKAREQRQKQYEEGLKRTGMGGDAPGGAAFTGASKVVHPMLTEASIDFAARAIKELFPPEGPVKDKIIGEVTDKKRRKAKRKTRFMNLQLTTQCREFRAELEQTLTQVPMGGVQYMKATWDTKKRKPRFFFVPVDHMLIPFAASNYYDANRRTHAEPLTDSDFADRVRLGVYRDIESTASGVLPEQTLPERANDKIEGREDSGFNIDGLRIVYEVDTEIVLSIDGNEPRPYLISIDENSQRIVSIYRNWDEEDPTYDRMLWAVEFPFIPWRGAYAVGLPHIIGSLSGAATGILRALLDSAFIQNQPGAFKLKGMAVKGQTIKIGATEVTEIDAGPGVDDVRKALMPIPFNPPSGVLFQLLGAVSELGKSVIRTTLDNASDDNANVPVGTTMARLEEGLVVFSAIHGRMHDALGRLLEILHRMNGMYLDDESVARDFGEQLVARSDFTGPADVQPVSDPNIFSENQRFAQIQAVAQRAGALPQLYNLRKVEERLLERLRIPNPKDLLLPGGEGEEAHPIDENVAMASGRPATAYEHQNHEAHITAHIAFMLSPAFGKNPLLTPQLLPALVAHIQQHIVLAYAKMAKGLASDAIGGREITDAYQEARDFDEQGALEAFDEMAAEASQIAAESMTQFIQSIAGPMQEAQQIMQQLQQQAAAQAAAANTPQAQVQMAETQRKAAADQQEAKAKMLDTQVRAQTKQAELQARAQEVDKKLAADAQGVQIAEQGDSARNAQDNQTDLLINSEDNRTALTIAGLEAATGERIALETGSGVNPDPNRSRSNAQGQNAD